MKAKDRIVPWLDLSTAHLTEKDAQLLAHAAASEILSVLQSTDPTSAGGHLEVADVLPQNFPELPPLQVSQDGYGYIMRLASGDEYVNDRIATLKQVGFSKTFIAIFKYAIEMKCWGIRFDVDGEIIEGFPDYDW